jgi:hypothetical protein
MEGSKTPLAMCTICHVMMEMPAVERKETVLDRIFAHAASVVDRILTRVVRILFERNRG